MSRTKVVIPGPLRDFTGGASEVEVDGETVAEVLRSLTTAHPELKPRILNDRCELRHYVSVFVDDTHIRSLDALESRVVEGSTISIVPAVAGG